MAPAGGFFITWVCVWLRPALSLIQDFKAGEDIGDLCTEGKVFDRRIDKAQRHRTLFGSLT